jgi:AcrR family transcriptional regulator
MLMTHDAKAADGAPIWARPEPGTRQSRFSREQIAAAALQIADADGFEAVTMRKIAARLGAGTMSLYRYIATKDDLVALMDDALMGEAIVPEGELPAGWRDALAAVARRTRETLIRHPWAVQALHGAPAAQNEMAGPYGLRHFEQSLAALDGAPLDTGAKLSLLAIIDDYVFGHALQAGELLARLRTDMNAPRVAATEAFIRAQLASGQFPHLQALAEEPAARSLADPALLTARFELGLRLLIDGIAGGAEQPAGGG